jgi:superfamily II DNA or RNA helicase
MREVHLNSRLVFHAPSLTADEIEKLKELSSGSNPAYKSYEKLIRLRPGLAYSKSYQVPPQTIQLWTEYSDSLLHLFEVPRGLYKEVEKMGFKLVSSTVPVPAKFELDAVLRLYQEEAVDEVTKERYGLLEAPTGSGKTIMGLAIATKLQQKTLFVVHTKTLLKQTINEVEKKLHIKAGVIGDGKYDIKDFTVATIQTLMRKPIPDNEFGLIIFDECHHVPATTFTKVARSIKAHYMYGLSATPTRPDGLTWALHATIGPTLYTVPREVLLKNKSIVKPQIITVPTPYKPTTVFDPFDVASHLNDIAQNEHRNLFLVSYIEKVFREHPETRPVILTDRINHVEYLAKALADKDPIIYHGQLGAKEQQTNLHLIKTTTRLTIATYSSIGEGFDVPLWDTLFLATPFSSPVRLVQVIGRVSRPAPGKSTAYVHDFVDIYDSVLYSRYEKRQKAYDAL